MKHLPSNVGSLLVLVVCALGVRAAFAETGHHAFCPSAHADACAVYDTGRLTGTRALTKLAADGDVMAALALPPAIDVLVLGEAHDNPHHHKARVAIVASRAKAIVMEQLRADQKGALTMFNDFNLKAARTATLQEFKSKVDWATGGWDKYPYDPLLNAVITAQVPVYAGDPPRDLIRKTAKEGAEALPHAERARLALDQSLGDKLDAVSGEEIEASHCGMLPKAAIPRMAFAQRYRDAHIADVTLTAAAAGRGSVVLLTGNNHARTDRGVPWYIRARAPDTKVVAVAFVEVEPGQIDPEAYVPRDPDDKPVADYLVLTPTIARDDPCAGFAK
jgi:uncharacterized iron-regulated protein